MVFSPKQILIYPDRKIWTDQIDSSTDHYTFPIRISPCTTASPTRLFLSLPQPHIAPSAISAKHSMFFYPVVSSFTPLELWNSIRLAVNKTTTRIPNVWPRSKIPRGKFTPRRFEALFILRVIKPELNCRNHIS